MSTQHIKLKGTANWAKVFEHNKDRNEDFHGPGGAYTIDVLLGKEEMDKFTATGSRIKPKITDDGLVLKFKRKHTHHIPALGGAPQVVDAENEPWDGRLIGNGSEVEVAISVYETKMGKGTRLEGVRVVDLVEFESEGGGEDQKYLPF